MRFILPRLLQDKLCKVLGSTRVLKSQQSDDAAWRYPNFGN